MFDINNTVFCAVVTFISFAVFIFLKLFNKVDYDPNSVIKTRKIPIGKVDDKGWKQEKVVQGKVEKDNLPEGLKPEDVSTSIKVEIKTMAIPSHKVPTRTLVNKIKNKYGRFLFTIFLVLVVNMSFMVDNVFSQGVFMETEDYEQIMSSLDKLALIEEAEPIISLKDIEMLVDSAGRVYSKPVLDGTMEISSLKYKLTSDLKISVIHARKKYNTGKLFSLSALYSDQQFGIAGTFELFNIRPLIYVNIKTYGIGLKLNIYNNLGFLIGMDYPSYIPRFGFLFRI